MLVNARHARNLPGRKTDVSDAQWLAELGAHGLVRPSFVPPEPIRELRDPTRARATFCRGRTREIQRLEKLLEDAGLKLSSVATQITGVSSRAMLGALIEGERDPAVLAELARGRLRSKISQLTDALQGRFSDRHAVMTREHLERIDRLEESISRLDKRIKAAMVDYEPAVAVLWHDPRRQHHRRARDHCRDRRRHDAVPDRGSPRVVGWCLSWPQRVSRQGQVIPSPPRQLLPQGRTRHRSL